jgi:hypothetical protein
LSAAALVCTRFVRNRQHTEKVIDRLRVRLHRGTDRRILRSIRIVSFIDYIQKGIRVINRALSGSTHPVTKIPFKDGFPDFSSVATHTVQLENLAGNRAIDEAAANAAAELESTPTGYTWHHIEDANTMQLVPSDIHQQTAHTGGVAWLRKSGTAGGAGVLFVGTDANAAPLNCEREGFWQSTKDVIIDIVTDPLTYLSPPVSGFLAVMRPSPAY